MGEKRRLDEKYDELVFPDKPWSPSVGEVATLIKLAKGAIIGKNLRASLNKRNVPAFLRLNEQLENYNSVSYSKHREIVGKFASQALTIIVIHSPDGGLSEQEEQSRRYILATAIREIGAEMLTDQR